MRGRMAEAPQKKSVGGFVYVVLATAGDVAVAVGVVLRYAGLPNDCPKDRQFRSSQLSSLTNLLRGSMVAEPWKEIVEGIVEETFEGNFGKGF